MSLDADETSQKHPEKKEYHFVLWMVPVWNRDKVSYLSVPLGYRMWQKKESKLELAASMIRQVMPEFHSKDHIIILCDSWYTLHDNALTQYITEELERNYVIDIKKDLSIRKTNLHCIYGEKNRLFIRMCGIENRLKAA